MWVNVVLQSERERIVTIPFYLQETGFSTLALRQVQKNSRKCYSKEVTNVDCAVMMPTEVGDGLDEESCRI